MKQTKIRWWAGRSSAFGQLRLFPAEGFSCRFHLPTSTFHLSAPKIIKKKISSAKISRTCRQRTKAELEEAGVTSASRHLTTSAYTRRVHWPNSHTTRIRWRTWTKHNAPHKHVHTAIATIEEQVMHASEVTRHLVRGKGCKRRGRGCIAKSVATYTPTNRCRPQYSLH